MRSTRITAGQQDEAGGSAWLNVAGAAAHLATTATAVRSMVKRGELPVTRTPNGRLLFERASLDAWARGQLDAWIRGELS